MKPASAVVEIDLAIDVDSKNYDHDADSRVRIERQVGFLLLCDLVCYVGITAGFNYLNEIALCASYVLFL